MSICYYDDWQLLIYNNFAGLATRRLWRILILYFHKLFATQSWLLVLLNDFDAKSSFKRDIAHVFDAVNSYLLIKNRGELGN